MATIKVELEIFFLDGKKVTIRCDREQSEDDPMTATTFKKDLDFERIVVETDGDLVVIPMRNVKYVRARPAPARLPKAVLKNAEFIEE